MKTPLFFLFLLIAQLSFAQNNMKSDAEAMGNALITKDYDRYINYTYPKLVKDMGGKEKMVETIRKQMEDLEKQGVKILSMTYGEPTIIIKEKNELQATIPQQMRFQTAEGVIQAKSTLIGVSQDDGKHWYFIDPGERDLATVRITLPNLSKKLTLPPSEPVKIEK